MIDFCSIVVFLRWNFYDSCIGLVDLIVRNDTNSAISSIGCRTGVVGLLYSRIFGVLREWDCSTAEVLFLIRLVASRSRVHVSIRHTKVFPDISTDPIGWVLLVHRGHICLVLTWAWHVQILCSRVEFHAECEFGLLNSLLFVSLVRIRIREVEIRWNVILRTWHSLVLRLLLAFLPLNISNLGWAGHLIVNSRSFTRFVSHSEWRRFGSVGNDDGVVCSWAEIVECVLHAALLNIFATGAERPRGGLLRILRWMFSRWWHSTSLVFCFLRGSSKEWLSCTCLGKLGFVATWARGVLTSISQLIDIPFSGREAIAFCLMGFLVLAHIIVDVIVMGGTGFYEIAWSILVCFMILISTSTPSWDLRRTNSSCFCLHWIYQFVISWTRSIDFLGFQVRFWS